MKTKILTSLGILSSIILATGCGWDSTNTSTSETTSGTVVDGYIANAKVCYKDTNICTNTDMNGKFKLVKKNLELVVTPINDTVNTETSANYNSVLLAPAGYNVVTPLTTVITTQSIDSLANVLGIDKDKLETFIKEDPIKAAETNSSAAEIYAKGVVLDKILSSIMADSNSSNPTNKTQAINALFNIAVDSNKTILALSADDFKNVYRGYQAAIGGNPNNETNATKVATIAAKLVSLIDQNITDLDQAKKLETTLSTQSISALMKLNDSNLTNSLNSLVSNVISIVDPTISNTQTSAVYTTLAQDVVAQPVVNTVSYIQNKDIADTNYTIIIQQGKDFNLSDATKFSVKIDDNDFLTLDNNATQAFNQDGNITLIVNPDSLVNPVQFTTLYITPKNDNNDIGETKKILILVNKPTTTRSVVLLQSLQSDINLDASLNNYQLSDEQLTTDVKVGTPNKKFIFADSNNSKVVSVDMNDTDVVMHNLTNGSAKVLMVTMDDNFNVEFNTTNVNISNIDLPPLLDITNYPSQIAGNNNVDVNISYSLHDVDDVNDGYSVSIKGCENDPQATTKEGNITCTLPVDSKIHAIELQGSDGYLNSTIQTIYIQTLQGDVPPTLTLFLPSTSIEMDTMTSKSFSYIANDLNGKDTFEINATSSNPNVAKVSIDTQNSQIIVSAQAKVGSSTISVWATDNTGLKSKLTTFTVNTTNKLADTINSLYLVPAMDKDGKLLDNRYKLTNFDMSYDIADNAVILKGEINATKEQNLSLDDTLDAYPEKSFYANYGTLNNDMNYGFIFANGFSYQGQFTDGKVLVFTEGNDTDVETPYIWGLATQDQICNAYKNNKTSLDNIQAVNSKTIDCE